MGSRPEVQHPGQDCKLSEEPDKLAQAMGEGGLDRDDGERGSMLDVF